MQNIKIYFKNTTFAISLALLFSSISLGYSLKLNNNQKLKIKDLNEDQLSLMIEDNLKNIVPIVRNVGGTEGEGGAINYPQGQIGQINLSMLNGGKIPPIISVAMINLAGSSLIDPAANTIAFDQSNNSYSGILYYISTDDNTTNGKYIYLNLRHGQISYKNLGESLKFVAGKNNGSTLCVTNMPLLEFADFVGDIRNSEDQQTADFANRELGGNLRKVSSHLSDCAFARIDVTFNSGFSSLADGLIDDASGWNLIQPINTIEINKSSTVTSTPSTYTNYSISWMSDTARNNGNFPSTTNVTLNSNGIPLSVTNASGTNSTGTWIKSKGLNSTVSLPSSTNPNGYIKYVNFSYPTGNNVYSKYFVITVRYKNVTEIDYISVTTSANITNLFVSY